MEWLNLPLILQAVVMLFIFTSGQMIYDIKDIKLINKTRPWAGVLEVYIAELDMWGIICNGPNIEWGFDLASVACNRSGFPGTSLPLFATNFDDDGDSWSASIFDESRANFSCRTGNNFLQCRQSTDKDECSLGNVPAVTCKGHSYLGCFNDPCGVSGICPEIIIGTSDRTLSAAIYHLDDNSVDRCINKCWEHVNGPYEYAGVEYGRQCFCGNDDYTRKGKVDDSACRIPCKGDTRDTCGGKQKISVYEVTTDDQTDKSTMTTTPDVTSSTAQSMTPFENMETTARTLKVTPDDNESMTTTPDVTSSSTISLMSLTTVVTKNTNVEETSFRSTGVGIGVAVIILFLIVAVFIIVILRKRRTEIRSVSNGGKNETVAGAGDPSFSRLSQRNQGNRTTETNQYDKSSEVDVNVNTLPSNDTNTYYSICRPNDCGIAMSSIPMSDSSAECRAPTDGDVYTNTEFHDVPSNLVENELYNL